MFQKKSLRTSNVSFCKKVGTKIGNRKKYWNSL